MEPIMVQRRVQDALEWQLEELNLSGLEISVLPRTIKDLENIRALTLSNNKLTKFPDSLLQMEVKFEESSDEESAIEHLVWGIRGERP